MFAKLLGPQILQLMGCKSAPATAWVTFHQRTYIRRLAAVNRMLLFDLWPMALHDMSFESSRYHAPSLQPPTLLDPFLSSTCQAHLQSFGVLLLFLLAMLLVVRPQPPDIGSFQFQSKAMMWDHPNKDFALNIKQLLAQHSHVEFPLGTGIAGLL